MPGEITMHVVSHTHWDREWYQPFEVFRARLVDLIDNLLALLEADPSFRAFHLDGQTILLEDYLEIRPENEQRLRALVREGRILIGPWYLLSDEFLTSGEATVRNLALGHRISAEWGANMRIGYLPDQFGHIGQMPQILRGFGMDSAVFGRGWQIVGDRKAELTWRAPDGAEVFAVLMPCWYNNAQRFPEDADEALAFTERARDALVPLAASPHLLLMNGVDHLEAQAGLPGILASVREMLPEGQRIIHSTLPDYLAQVRESLAGRDLDVHEGELREDRYASVLAGTLSARMYLKVANDACQRLLERVAEPLATFAAMVGAGYPGSFLAYAWKQLLKNHPHDSICGCSTDETHLDMEPRFRHARQVAEAQVERSLAAIAEATDTSGGPAGSVPVVLVNTLPWPRTDPVTVTVDFPDDTAPASIELRDSAGKCVPVSVLSNAVVPRRDISPTALPKTTMVRRFRLGLVAKDVPAGGVRVLHAAPTTWRAPERSQVLRSDDCLENEYLRARVQHSGSLALLDKVTGYTYEDLNTFLDNGDVGSEYLHEPPVPDRLVTSHGWSPTISVVEAGPTRASIAVAGNLLLPESSSREGRSSECVPCAITSVISVAMGVPRVEIETTVENRARDHRLRVAFPTGLDADVAYAEGQFDIVRRAVRPPRDWPGAASCGPQQGFVGLHDGHRGLCLINEGLPEYEVLDDARRTICLTLLRCVGRLSTGPECAGLDVTEDAQMLGRFTFRYGLAPHAGDFLHSGAIRQAHQQRVPLQHVATTPHAGRLQSGHAFLEVEPKTLVTTATKVADDGSGIVVRLYNPMDAAVEGSVCVGSGVEGAWETDLLEMPRGRLSVTGGCASFVVSPRRILTILLAPAGGWPK